MEEWLMECSLIEPEECSLKEGSHKIMVVDDEADIVFILRCMLRRQGYEVIEAFSGEECLERIEEEKPDLVIMDIMMPGLDGWEVCKKIKENYNTSAIPVSMLSVKKSSEDRKKSLEYAHADEHLVKPIELHTVINTVESLLRKEQVVFNG
jgi:DNA-binding response OmpR family regulator